MAGATATPATPKHTHPKSSPAPPLKTPPRRSKNFGDKTPHHSSAATSKTLPPGDLSLLYTRPRHRSGVPPLSHHRNGSRRGEEPAVWPATERGKRDASVSPLRTVAPRGETSWSDYPKHQSWPQRNLPVVQNPQNPRSQLQERGAAATSGGRTSRSRREAPGDAGGMARSSSGSGASPCDLDREFAPQIAQLLAAPPPQSAQEYYEELIQSKKHDGIRVNYKGDHGKGVCANKDFAEGDLILKDQILVGAQHSLNKIDCVVCSYCFRFIGSVEFQIGHRLYFQSIASSIGCSSERHCHGSDVGSSTCSSGVTKEKSSTLPQEVIESLITGDVSLPFSDHFALPEIIACQGCEEERYCSQSCADSDWESYHSLLCAGPNTEPPRRSALHKFVEHANETNDIFLVAAKAITFTMLRYKKLKRQNDFQNKSAESKFSLLMEAWKPLSMGFKKRWWDYVALPEDVDASDEDSFRQELRDLAFTSLELLKDAIFDAECAPLFSLEVYGHIIGMFELNNLDLVVASPVEDYFIHIDDLPDDKKEEAEKATAPFLDALDDDYAVPCDGTAFFPLQSCMNHSCCPNAKAFKRDEDNDGHAVIIALGPISKGEEITISYIDEDLPYEERQAELADYGFTCTCSKCQEEKPN